jgi:uncharacterized repeat protein (TIGR01451 family)
MKSPINVYLCVCSAVQRRALLRTRALPILICFALLAISAASLPIGANAQGDPSADLVVIKSGDDTAPVGGQILYSVVVTNAGPNRADNVVLTDAIPEHTQFVNASVSQGSVSFDGTTITASFGAIAEFESASLSLTVSVNLDTPRNTSITNIAGATSDTTDPDTDNNTASFTTVVTGPFLGDVIISEFRFRGPTPSGSPSGASADEFIEIYNNTDLDIVVSDRFAIGEGPVAAGWAVVSSDAPSVPKFVIPNGTVIRGRGHYLAVNSIGYSLSGYPAGSSVNAIGDISYTSDIPDNAGIALFRTASPNAFNEANRFDAVGFSVVADPLFREGNGLGLPVTANVEHSFVRQLLTGLPQDTDNNLADFSLVATNGNQTVAAAQLGAPGPENTFSPIQRNSLIKSSLIEPLNSSDQPPNRVRTGSGDSGTLSLRRRFRNNTGGAISRLRFRVVNVTTLGTPVSVPSQADVRLVTSADFPITTSLGSLFVRGTVVEEPPAQPLGGGLNTSAVVFLPGGALAQGASVDLQFLLNVVKSGSFRFLVNVEALENTEPPTLTEPGKGQRPQKIRRTTRK